MSIWFPPNSWRVILVVAALSTLLSFLHSREIHGWAYADLAAVSAEYRQCLLTVGIVVAGASAWTSSVASPPSLAYAPAGSSRKGAPLVLSHGAGLFAAGAGGLILGLAPVTAVTKLRSDYGSVDILVVASGLVTLLAYIGIGYLLGCALPYYLAVPVSLCVAYLAVFLTDSPIAPAFSFDIISGLAVPSEVSLIRVCYFLAVFGATTLASIAWFRNRTVTELRAAAMGAVLPLLPLVLLTSLVRSYDGPLVEVDGADPVCRQWGPGYSACVHPARASMLPELRQALIDILDRAGGAAFPPVSVVDATLDQHDAGSAPVYPLQLQAQSDAWREIAELELVSQAAGVFACYRMSAFGSRSEDVSSAVGAWVLEGLGAPTDSLLLSEGAQDEYEKLMAMPSDDVRELIAQNISDVSSCNSDGLE